MESLKPVPFGQWVKLLEFLKLDWPTHSWYYNWASNALKCKTIDPLLSQEIYCPNGDLSSGVFVGIQGSEYGLTIVTLFSFKENRELLKKCLLETELIDWTQKVFFSFIHENFYPAVDQVFQEKKKLYSEMIVKNSVDRFYVKPKEACAKVEIGEIPEGFELRPIEASNIPLINSVWPHGNKNNPESTEKLFRDNLAFDFRNIGLFKKDDNSLVAWIFYGVLGTLQALQVLDNYKRRGFGKLVVKALIKQLATKDNIVPTLFILDKNKASISLFESLDFKFCAKAYSVAINEALEL